MTALLVTPGNRFLRQLMPAMPLSSYETWTPAEYEEAPDEMLIENGRCRFDVVIFDAHSTDRLPPAGYLFFDGIPLIESVDRSERPVENGVFLDWDETHPVLRHVAVGAMTVFSWRNLELPDDAVVLIDGTTGPVMALVHEPRRDYLISAFGLFDETRSYLNTDWVFQEGLVVFFYNALRYLSGGAGSGYVPGLSPGEAFTVAAADGATSVTVRTPEGEKVSVPVRGDELAAFGSTNRIGIYTATPVVEGDDARAVSLLSDEESLIAPNREFRIAAGEFTSSEEVERTNQPLWPYVLMALGVILFFEWFIYNKRVFI
jgi:hypothetical protein